MHYWALLLIFVAGCQVTKSFEINTSTSYTNNGDPVITTTARQTWSW